MNEERKDGTKTAGPEPVERERRKLGLRYGGAPSQRPLPQVGSAK
jgi:hypothetical protein